MLPPADVYWNATWAIPELSEAVPVSEIVPRRFWPGSFWVVAGPLLSTWVVTAAEVRELPALSVAITCRS